MGLTVETECLSCFVQCTYWTTGGLKQPIPIFKQIRYHAYYVFYKWNIK